MWIGICVGALAARAARGATEGGGLQAPADPVTALALAVTVAALFGSPSRAGRARGAALGAAAAAGVAGGLLGAVPAVALAALLGGAVAFLAPAQGPRLRDAWDAGGEGSAVARF